MEDFGFKPNLMVYTSIKNRLMKHHQVDETIELFRLMNNNEIRAGTYTYSTLIGGLCKSGRLEEVQHFRVESVIKGDDLDSVTYHTITNVLS